MTKIVIGLLTDFVITSDTWVQGYWVIDFATGLLLVMCLLGFPPALASSA